ncbi:MAG: amino acid permease [Selenomonadaceae bacterium]|nr:amino acid permease [Selenomonadaceae bacterium]
MEHKFDEGTRTLSKYLTPLNVWALAFGCSIGWGSFAMPPTTFLPLAGPVGTTIAMSISALIMLVIAGNYHYMINRFPDSGGAFTYIKKIFGYDHAFLCVWFLWFAYLDLLWGNATSCALIYRNIFDNFFQFGFHYNLAGYEIYFGEVFLTLAIIIAVGIFCARKRFFVGKLNTIAALIFLLGGLVCIFLTLSDTSNKELFTPSFATENSPVIQILGIMAFAPWAFMGFEGVSNAAGEFNFSPKKSFAIMAAVIIFSAIFYISMNCLTIAHIPAGFSNWETYLSRLGESDKLPIVYAVNESLGKSGVMLLGLTMAATILTSLIGFYFVTSRLMYVIAKDNLLPKRFTVLDASRIPGNAVIFVMLISLIIPFVGRNVLGWWTDITTIGALITYGYVSAATMFSARAARNGRYMLLGALGIIFSLMFVGFFINETLKIETYLIIALWSIIGCIVFRITLQHDKERRFGNSIVVWIVMLSLIFFSSLMWARQTMTENFNVALKNITQYFTDELANYGLKPHVMHRLREQDYIQAQIDSISSSIFANNLLQIALVVFTLFIMFNVYAIMRNRERSAEEAKIRAEARSRAKTHFLSNMSHDIRTPMNAIIGYTTLALREDATPAQMRNFLGKIGASSQHLLALINDVLEMSRIESGKIELTEVPADLFKMLNDVRDMFAEQMTGKNINFTVEFSNVTNRYVRCDKNHFNRVLLNLTSNAYKFTPEGGKIEMVLRQLRGKSKGFADYELRVKDSGIGMSEEFAKKIFEPFEREKTSTVSGVQGTGLGMAITKSIIDMMKGNISLVTKQGQGTEFIVNVRFAIEPEPPQDEIKIETVSTIDSTKIMFADVEKISEPVEETPKVEKVPAQKKLLLAEDIEVNREIATMILEEFGFKVEVAVNGKEAVEKISAAQEGEFDAILMDVQMPVMDGYEATKAIRALKNKKLASIPIIAMTANAFNEDIDKAKSVGMNAHIAKPLDVPTMMETLKKVVSEK